MLRSGSLSWLLAISLSAGLLSYAADSSADFPVICGALGLSGLADGAPLLIAILSPAGLAAGWLLMLTAMMPPLLGQPVNHVWNSSFSHRRARALAWFGLGYTAVWFALGALLVPLTIYLRMAASGWRAAALAIFVAVLWSCSPAAQAARNRCHRLGRIGAFGWPADRDCIKQGLATGIACAAACWPWMIVPLTIDRFHLAVMLAVSVTLFLERLAPPGSPRWRWPPAAAVFCALFVGANAPSQHRPAPSS